MSFKQTVFEVEVGEVVTLEPSIVNIANGVIEYKLDEEGIVTVTIDKEAYNYFKDNNYYASAGHCIMIDLEYSIEVLDVLNVDLDSCDYLLDDLIGE